MSAFETVKNTLRNRAPSQLHRNLILSHLLTYSLSKYPTVDPVTRSRIRSSHLVSLHRATNRLFLERTL